MSVPAILGGPLSPVGWSVGFLEAPLEVAVDELLRWRRELGASLELADVAPWPDCLTALDPLEAPWTTELMVDHGVWTAYLNNDIKGGDPWPATSYVASLLDVRWVIGSHQPMTAPGHATTQFQLGGPEGEEPLRFIRTISAHAEDGRWSWDESGAVLPFERPQAYGARRIRERLTRNLLVEYLAAMGIDVDEPTRYGAGCLVRQQVTWRTRRERVDAVRRSWGLA